MQIRSVSIANIGAIYTQLSELLAYSHYGHGRKTYFRWMLVSISYPYKLNNFQHGHTHM